MATEAVEQAQPETPGTDWVNLIGSAAQPEIISAVTFAGMPNDNTYCSPRILMANNGRDYYVKSAIEGRPNVMRCLIADQIVGRIGETIGAPVAAVELIEVSEEFIRVNDKMKGTVPGISHGSRVVKFVTATRDFIYHAHEDGNKERFADLAMLYGLCVVDKDHQFFYSIKPPPTVYSFDHGHFFPGGPEWSKATIENHTATAVPDVTILGGCARLGVDLTDDVLRTSAQKLVALTDKEIAAAIAAPPSSWGFTGGEQVALATMVAKHRDQLLAMYSA